VAGGDSRLIDGDAGAAHRHPADARRHGRFGHAVAGAPLFETRRFGKFAYRSQLLASGKVQPREGETTEEVPSASAVGSALNDIDIKQLVGARDLRHRPANGRSAASRRWSISSRARTARCASSAWRAGQEMAGFLDQAVAARDPALAAGRRRARRKHGRRATRRTTRRPASTSASQSAAQAQAALAAAAAYFAQSEPSSPIMLLIGQAQALVGRSFYEAMQVLLPDRSAEARLRIGQIPPSCCSSSASPAWPSPCGAGRDHASTPVPADDSSSDTPRQPVPSAN
jgi:type VI secretion system protein ImpA